MRRYLIASVGCGVVIACCTIASAVVLAGIVAAVITDPASRSIHQHAWPLSILLALWLLRALAHWLQGRLSQRGATAVIADLSGQVLRSVTALPPRQLATDATRPRWSSPVASTACGRTSPPTCPRCSWPASSPRPLSW